jgi:hypothetical protein
MNSKPLLWFMVSNAMLLHKFLADECMWSTQIKKNNCGMIGHKERTHHYRFTVWCGGHLSVINSARLLYILARVALSLGGISSTLLIVWAILLRVGAILNKMPIFSAIEASCWRTGKGRESSARGTWLTCCSGGSIGTDEHWLFEWEGGWTWWRTTLIKRPDN